MAVDGEAFVGVDGEFFVVHPSRLDILGYADGLPALIESAFPVRHDP